MSIPAVSARSRSSESARIRLPSSVSRSIRPVGDDDDDADDDRDQLRAADREAEELDGRGVVDVEAERCRCPSSNWITARIRNASPIDISTSCSSPARLRAHRRPHDLLGQDAEHRGRRPSRRRAPNDQRHAPGDVHQVRHVGAEGEEVAVGEVDELQDPVDERQADRAERVDRAGREAGEAGLGDLVQALRDRPSASTSDGEDHERGCAPGAARPSPCPCASRGRRLPDGQRSGLHPSADPIPAGPNLKRAAADTPVADSGAELAAQVAITASVNSVVSACPPRSGVRVPAATVSSTALVDGARGALGLAPA